MGADLGAVAVLERRDDAAAVGVVLRIGGGDYEDVQRQTYAVAADLHVALLHDVEQPHLDALCHVREFVDAEDAPVVPGDQAVMYRQLVREVAALGHLDRVDLADQVGDGDVRGGQLLPVAGLAVQPGQLRVVPLLINETSAARAYRVERGIVDLAARYGRYLFVQQPCQGADHA